MKFLSDESLQNNVDKGSLLVGCLSRLVLVVNDYLYFGEECHGERIPEAYSTLLDDATNSLQYLWMFENVYRFCRAILTVRQAPSYQVMIRVAMDLWVEILTVATAEMVYIVAICLIGAAPIELRFL